MTSSNVFPTKDQQARYAIATLADLGQQYQGVGVATNFLNDIRDRLGPKELQPKIGTWNVVWGPGLYRSDPSSSPDNLMFVAQQAKTNTYAVGIAGANFSGTSFDLLREDLEVDETVPWLFCPVDDKGRPLAAIAKGTFLGLSILRQISAADDSGQVARPAPQRRLPGRTGRCRPRRGSGGGSAAPLRS